MIVSGPEGITVDSEHGDIVDNVWGGDGSSVSVAENGGAASGLLLGPPTPNPSRGVVAMALTLPEEDRVSFRVYDVQGRLVDEVVEGVLSPGHHHLEWRPAGDLPAGIYLARLHTRDETRVQRVVLLR